MNKVFKRFYSKDLTGLSDTEVHMFRLDTRNFQVFESTFIIVFLLIETSSLVSFNCSSIRFSLQMSF